MSAPTPRSCSATRSRCWRAPPPPAPPSRARRSPPASARCVPEGRTHAYVLHDGTDAGGPRILITQGDVRAIQLAKSALYAGARLLMDQLGVDAVDRVVLAGAFGAHISPKHAMVLGMIPDCDLAKVTS